MLALIDRGQAHDQADLLVRVVDAEGLAEQSIAEAQFVNPGARSGVGEEDPLADGHIVAMGFGQLDDLLDVLFGDDVAGD